MAQTYYPAADSKKQNFASAYQGSKMTPNVLVLHSTEGYGWPAYSSGAVAPHFTISPDFASKTVIVRQHFPVNVSARALENHAGGVETNTLNAVQIELVGTCDPATHKKWGAIPHIYMPEAPDWFLAGVADVVRWLHAQYPAFPIRDAAPRGWLAYPASYGNAKGQRLSFAEWDATYGIVGHQHVPENVHGDPGAFPIARLVALALGEATAPVEPPKPVDPTKPLDVMDPANYPPNGPSTGPQIQWIGERLVAHGFGKAYSYGPTPEWGTADRANLQSFQLAQGWTGSDADGYPGVETLKRLAATPAPKPKGVVVTTASQNFAGNNAKGIATSRSRIPKYVASRKTTPVDVIDAQETTVASLVRPLLDSGLKTLGYKRAGGGKGRYVYTGSRVKVVASGLITAPKTTWYKRDDKQAAWVVYSIDGALGMDVSFHAESDSGATADALRVKQVLYFGTEALKIAAAHKVPEANVMLAGDTNSEGQVLAAMLAAGWRNVAAGTSFEDAYTFMGWDGKSRKRFDYGFVRTSALPATLIAVTRDTSIADHGGLRITRQLTK